MTPGRVKVKYDQRPRIICRFHFRQRRGIILHLSACLHSPDSAGGSRDADSASLYFYHRYTDCLRRTSLTGSGLAAPRVPGGHYPVSACRHTDYPQVSYATGFSGHGYKFASVIGEVMADLAERQQTRHDISLFSLERLTGQVSALYENRPGQRRTRPVQQYRRFGRAHPQQRIRIPERSRHSLRQHAVSRGSSGMTEQYGYLESSDPRYWDVDDVKPFW